MDWINNNRAEKMTKDTKDAAHKLPWRYTDPKQKGDFPPILNAIGEFMGASFDVAGAEHIVKCVNSHQDLVEQLKQALYLIEAANSGEWEQFDSAVDWRVGQIKQTLEKAGVTP